MTTKSSRSIFPVFLAGIPSKTKGVLINLRGQQIALGPQTNNKLKSPNELRGSCVLVVAEISRKTKGVFANRLQPAWTASASRKPVFDLLGLNANNFLGSIQRQQ